MGDYVVAVDVGTGSARAGVFDRSGAQIARASRPIAMRRDGANVAEHSSDDIWLAVCASVREAVASAAIGADNVGAIGFGATCSLVFLDAAGKSISIAPDGSDGWDTIAWLDHRSIDQARSLTASDAPALRHCGGIISPEMQLPKIMWVREHLPDVWRDVARIFDLADFLTFRATGHGIRSASTLMTKWNYLAHDANGWDPALLVHADLEDLPDKAGMDGQPLATGKAVGTLSQVAACALGLSTQCGVAAGMVDAYAGALALLGAERDSGSICLIGGTSSCVMRHLPEPVFLPAFWGPFYGASLTDRWIVEGGQSAAGALLDHVLRLHLGRAPVVADHETILERIAVLLSEADDGLGRGMHVLPDFHGNRTPFSDPSLLGIMHGLSLDSSADATAALYYRTMVGLALGMRQIIETLESETGPIGQIHLGGGQARTPLFATLYADATGRDVVISSGDEAMLLGTAMTAASAAGWHDSLAQACEAMRRQTQAIVRPERDAQSALDRDYRIFRTMQRHRAEIAAIS